MKKSQEPINYIVTGSRYQVLNDKGELIPEYGVGKFRSGIQLDLALKLYVALLAKRMESGSGLNGEPGKRTGREVAAAAFGLTEVFLDEMDKACYRPPPPPAPENDAVKVRR